MIIDQRAAAGLVAAYGSHKKVGSLVSTSQMAAFGGVSMEESRRILMNGIMSGSMKLIQSSGGSIVCEVVSKDQQNYNALLIEASCLTECNRIANEAKKH